MITFLFFLLYIPAVEMDSLDSDVHLQNEAVHGRVLGDVRITDKTIQFVIETDDKLARIMVMTFLNHPSLDKPATEHIGVGAKCEMIGELQLPDTATNPYQFNYRQYLNHQGITYVMYVDKIEQINCQSPQLLHQLHLYRKQLITSVMNTYDERIYPWIVALVFGDDQFLDKDTIQLFQRWGLSHILAISGLHIGIIVALVYLLFIRFSLMTIEKAQWFIVISLPIYAIIAGGQPSVMRASMMIVIFVLLQRIKWKMNAVDLLSVVFIILVLWNKWIVYHVGFQLSFTVTFGLLLSRKIFSTTNNRLFQLLQISFISQMMIIPLQIYYFYQFNPLSILLNVIIVPYFSIIVIPFMFFLIMTTWLPTFIHSYIANIFAFVHDFILNGIFFLDTYFYYPMTTGYMTIILAVIYYVFLILFFITMEKKDVKKQVILGTAIVCLITYLNLPPFFQKNTKITVLDIGQGDAIILELPYRSGVFIIDAGAMVTFGEEETEISNKVYEQVIKPYLLGSGITSIDAIFLSHDHVDHVGSVSFLLEDFSVGEVVLSSYFAVTRPDWLEDIKVREMTLGNTLRYDGIAFHAVSPERNYHDTNTNSLVLYTEIANVSFLFTGDLTSEAEREIMKNYPSMKIDVLKVGHHGSDTSTSEAFLQHIDAKVALIPVGRNNRYDHPHDEVIARLQERGMHVFRTDKHGAIQLQIKNGSLEVHPYRKE